MNFEELILDVYQKIKNIEDKGEMASYIPELSNVDPKNFGVHISTINQVNFSASVHDSRFNSVFGRFTLL